MFPDDIMLSVLISLPKAHALPVNIVSLLITLSVPQLSRGSKQMLLEYSWPGNVRELVNIAEYLVNIAPASNQLEDQMKAVLLAADNGFSHELLKTSSASIKVYFPTKQFRDESLAILRIMAEVDHEGVLLGRRTIMKSLEQSGCQLSEQQVKSRLEALHRNELIGCHVGKGSEITTEGRLYLLKE